MTNPCEGCEALICPRRCPAAMPPAEGLTCAACGRRIRPDEAYCEGKDGRTYCLDCVNASDANELLRICGIDSPTELAEVLGLLRSA